MTGSSLAPIVIALTVSIGLAAWLIMVYYAASHPLWKHQVPARELPAAGPAGPDARHLTAAQPGSHPAGNPPVPGPAHAGKHQTPHAA